MPRPIRYTAETLFPLTAPTDSQRSLLEAAERLIAIEGTAVTDRAIIAAAGHANKAAIAYHFGSRELLHIAIWDWRGRVVNDRREMLLADVERRGAERDLIELATAYVIPLEISLAEWYPSAWARFNEHEMRHMPQHVIAFLNRRANEFAHLDSPIAVLARLFNHMRAATCGGDESRASRRVALVARVVIGGFAAWERDVDAGLATLADLEDVADDLVGITVSILASPVTPGAPSRGARW